MVEDIDQHLAMGKKPLQAAFDASKEIGLAVLASAAAIIAVFLPVAFMGGVPGQFFQPFGVTVAVSTLFSSLIAVTVTPMLSAYILQPKKLKTGDDNPSSRPRFRPYKSLLTWALRHRILTLLAALAFFIGSFYLGIIVLLVAVPIGVGSALYLEEYAPLSTVVDVGTQLHSEAPFGEPAKHRLVHSSI